MPNTLFFVHDDVLAAEEVARPYVERGWHVEVCPSDEQGAVDRILGAEALVAVFFLDSSDGSCRALAHELIEDKRGGHPMVVFVDGDPQEIAQLRVQMPAALYVRLEELPWVLKHLSFKG